MKIKTNSCLNKIIKNKKTVKNKIGIELILTHNNNKH